MGMNRATPEMSQLAAIKGGSTEEIWMQLYRIKNKVPASIPDSNPHLRRLVALEENAASMRRDIINYPSYLAHGTGVIQTGLTQLEKAVMERGDQQAMGMRQEYVRQFTQLHSEANEKIDQRGKLLQTTSEFIRDKDAQHKEVLQAILDHKPEKQIEAMIASIEKKQDSLIKQVDNLNLNEEALQRKLDELHVKTVHSAQAIAGTSLEMPKSSSDKGLRR
jgi:hypothetical protein